MLSADVGVSEPARLFLRQHDHMSRLTTEPLEHAPRVGTTRSAPLGQPAGRTRIDPAVHRAAMHLDNALSEIVIV
jgi:hypothetical protein